PHRCRGARAGRQPRSRRAPDGRARPPRRSIPGRRSWTPRPPPPPRDLAGGARDRGSGRGPRRAPCPCSRHGPRLPRGPLPHLARRRAAALSPARARPARPPPRRRGPARSEARGSTPPYEHMFAYGGGESVAAPQGAAGTSGGEKRGANAPPSLALVHRQRALGRAAEKLVHERVGGGEHLLRVARLHDPPPPQHRDVFADLTRRSDVVGD